jgi:hypothetical protein
MLSSRPKIIFDTSVINQLEDRGADSEPLMRGLELGYQVCLTAMTADEILSITKNPERREALLKRFGRLLSNSRCIWPPNEVVRLHVLNYQHDRSQYDWRRVDVRAQAYEDVIARRTYPDISIEQRKVHLELKKQFEKAWKSLRPKLDDIIAKDPSQRLSDFREAADASIKPGGVLWGFGKGLYDHATGSTADGGITDDEVEVFIDVCPPFRAACYAFVMAWFNYSLSRTDVRIAKAGRNDLMMAVYLPYCDRFLTQDFAQHKDLTEIASAARLQSEVTFFEEFSRSFNLMTLARP